MYACGSGESSGLVYCKIPFRPCAIQIFVNDYKKALEDILFYSHLYKNIDKMLREKQPRWEREGKTYKESLEVLGMPCFIWEEKSARRHNRCVFKGCHVEDGIEFPGAVSEALQDVTVLQRNWFWLDVTEKPILMVITIQQWNQLPQLAANSPLLLQ